MGKTAFSGPAFGAKATLFSATFAASTGSSAVCAGTIIPAGEDWYATELSVFRSSSGSTDFTISLQDDGTTIGSVNVNGSSIAGGSGIARFTPTSGEYQGLLMASGSTLTFSHSSHAGPNAGVTVVLRGFPRWIASTVYTN